MFLANTPAQAEYILPSPQQAAGGIGVNLNANKTEFLCFKQEGAKLKLLKLVKNFTYLSSQISSAESDVNIRLDKAWTTIDRLWTSDQSDKMKQFFPSSVCVNTTVWMHHMDTNKMNGEQARWELSKSATAVLNKSLKKHPTKKQLYDHLPPISKTIKVR